MASGNNLEIEFRNKAQREFYYSSARNQCFSSGFNAGKSFIGCFKILTLCCTFPNYRALIARQTFKDLKATTMETFFKLCPKGIIKTHNGQDGVTDLYNGSRIRWFHLDNADENSLKGFEINSYLVDQAEETEEKMFDVLDARLGRWDEVEIPKTLLERFPNWPTSPTGKLIAPSYGMLLCNPDTEFHYIWRKFHPDSPDRDKQFFYVESEWDRNLGSAETYDKALQKDAEWVDKFVYGKWGTSSSAVHHIDKSSLIHATDISFYDKTIDIGTRARQDGNLFRSMDHGDSSPTCCLWVSAVDGVYVFYREYYVPGRTINFHRKNITDLSYSEKYSGSYADPQIFKKTAQKDGGFWSVADEYSTPDLDSTPLFWVPADNNEFATRNRINELLQPSSRFRHPINGTSPAPGIYFIQASAEYPYGCKESVRQLGMQRKKLLGTVEGKSIYSDDRDDNITDHAYDPIRYFVAMHGVQPNKVRKIAPRRSFAYYDQANRILESRREMNISNSVEEYFNA